MHDRNMISGMSSDFNYPLSTKNRDKRDNGLDSNFFTSSPTSNVDRQRKTSQGMRLNHNQLRASNNNVL